VTKFTATERMLIQNIVCNLSINIIPDNEIIKEVYELTKKTISKVTLFNVRKRVKKESSKWYSQLRQGEYEYIHEFKERINEIVDLQRRHYQIIEDNQHNPSVQQASLAALHKPNVTLSNYYDIVPYLTATGQRQTQEE
jgi:hypothetical protein